jgi:hypothetical protein
MYDKLSSISSPLTVIALFAAITEASALASLPFLDDHSQGIYTWFLVGFPPFLTLLFFITLNFNYRSLYPPEAKAAQAAKSAMLVESAALKTSDLTANPLLLLIAERETRELLQQCLGDLLDQLNGRHSLQGRLVACERSTINQALLSALIERPAPRNAPP